MAPRAFIWCECISPWCCAFTRIIGITENTVNYRPYEIVELYSCCRSAALVDQGLRYLSGAVVHIHGLRCSGTHTGSEVQWCTYCFCSAPTGIIGITENTVNYRLCGVVELYTCSRCAALVDQGLRCSGAHTAFAVLLPES